MVRFLLGSLLLSAACSSGPDNGPPLVEPCPSGWTSAADGATCTPPASLVASEKATLTSGVWGFARATTYGAAPGTTTASSALLANAVVALVPKGTQTPASVGSCRLSAKPVAVGMTDDDGVFAIQAPPGHYEIEVCTTLSEDLDYVAGSADFEQGVIEADVDYDDLPQ